MAPGAWVAIGWICLGLVGLLWAEARNSSAGLWITKPLASLGLLVLAFVVAGAPLESLQSGLVIGAVFFCVLGDVLLIPLNEKIFMAGIGSFAIGHLGYLAALVMRGFHSNARDLGVAVGVVLLVSAIVTRYLWPQIPKMLRPAVAAYVVLISALVLAGWSLSEGPRGAMLLGGTVAFYISDISVAMDRFVQRKFVYRLWGLPLYYLAQVLIIVGLLG